MRTRCRSAGRRCSRRSFRRCPADGPVNARQVVSPEAELRDGHRRRQKDADVQERADSRRAKKPNTIGIRIRPGIWKARSSQRRLMMMVASTARRQRPTRPPISCTFVTFAATLCCSRRNAARATRSLSPSVYPSLRRQRQPAPALYFWQTGHDPRDVLNCAKGRPIAHGEHHVVTSVVRRNSGEKAPRKLGRLSVPASRFCCHVGGFGQERTDDDQRNGWNQPRHHRVAPCACGSFTTPRPLRNSGM